MTVTFYQSASDPKAAYKSLTQVGTAITLKPFEPMVDISGRFLIAYDSTLEACNYCMIDGEPYFITNSEKDVGGRLWVYVKKDVLSKYISQLLSCPAVLDRAEQAYNAYSDDHRSTAQYVQQQCKSFGSFTWWPYYILVSVG